MTDLTPRCQDGGPDQVQLSALFAKRLNLSCPGVAPMLLGQPDQAERDREARRWHGCDHGHVWFAGVCGRCATLRGLPAPDAARPARGRYR